MIAALPIATQRAPVSRLRALRLKVEYLSIYMPVLLMALLALGSYWLLRATPSASGPVAERAVVHDPSDVMLGFSVRTYGPGGALKTEVFGQEARRFPDDNSMEMDQARVRSFSPLGVLTTAQASSVWTNAGHEEYVLKGQAVVVREAATLPSGQQLERLEFQGEQLHVFAQEERVSSSSPVLLIRGRNRVTANQMDWSERDRVGHLTGRVRATLAGRQP
jgi:lipopolysaccharide export system protein LptC